MEASDKSAYQAEIDDFIACLSADRALERVTPAARRLAVEATRREMDMIAERA